MTKRIMWQNLKIPYQGTARFCLRSAMKANLIEITCQNISVTYLYQDLFSFIRLFVPTYKFLELNFVFDEKH